MTKRKLWTYLAAGSALTIALGSAALGANATDSNGDATIPAALGHVASVTLPDKASSVASAVFEALTGGSNPSTVASNGKSNSEQATHTNTETNQNATTNTNVSAGQETSPAGTTGTRPGWGCGDLNHVHTGPPGRPNATSPCKAAQ